MTTDGKQVFQCLFHSPPFGKFTIFLCEHDLLSLQTFYSIEVIRRADEHPCEVCEYVESAKKSISKKLSQANL